MEEEEESDEEEDKFDPIVRSPYTMDEDEDDEWSSYLVCLEKQLCVGLNFNFHFL